jgi:GT2 family glycosyltransferase
LTPPISVAVVILNWNGKAFLEKFLPSVVASTYPGLSVYLADNASADDSVAFTRSHYPQVQVIRQETNAGFALGYNLALRSVQADIFVLLNSDVEVTPGWIEPVVALMASDASIAACQPKILDWNRKNYFEYAGGAGGWIDRYGYPFCRGRVFDAIEQDLGQYDDTVPIFWASGAAMFVRSHVFRELGGFDAFFFAHQEEIDLCWRMHHAGYQVYACPASRVYHVGGGTMPQGSPMKIFLNFRNNLIMLWKNLGNAERLWKIPYRMVLDLASAGKNLVQGNWSYVWAVIRAHLAFWGWMILHRRKSLFPAKKGFAQQTIYPGNAVWMHFARGLNSFSEILAAKK